MPWLTAEETAERYRIGVKGLLKQRTEGRLPGSLGKRVGKRVLWASEDLDWYDHPSDAEVTSSHESDSFGALHALVLELRGVNRRLDTLIKLARPKVKMLIMDEGLGTMTTEEVEDE